MNTDKWIIIIIIIIKNVCKVRTYFIDNNQLPIKILFTINSLIKTIPSKHYLQVLSFKKHVVLIRKNSLN